MYIYKYLYTYMYIDNDMSSLSVGRAVFDQDLEARRLRSRSVKMQSAVNCLALRLGSHLAGQ